VFSGGNPGLQDGQINFGNVGTYYFRESLPINDILGNGLISFPLPALDPGTYGPMQASIKDKTELRSKTWRSPTQISAGGPLTFVVSDYIFKPIKKGEIIPSSLLTHTLDLQMIPKNPKFWEVF
jgi:hypothetical protein